MLLSILANILFLGITINSMMDNTTENPVIRLAAQKYNKKIALNPVPKDVSHYMFSILLDPHNSVEENLRTSLVLNQVCTQLNDVSYYSTFLKKHDSKDKNAAFIEIFNTINDAKYFSRRKPLMLLLHAGAGPNCSLYNDCLLARAVDYNDIDMISLLSSCKADFNRKGIMGYPIFFDAKITSVLDFFIRQEINLNESGEGHPNVLWKIFSRSCAGDLKILVQFYLDNNVSVNLIDEDKQCLLHRISMIGKYYYSDNYKEAVELIFTQTSRMINLLDKGGKTPLDTAYKHDLPMACVELFKKYGAKRARELSI